LFLGASYAPGLWCESDYDLEDRERMIKTAVSRIWQIDPVATFLECREFAKLISAKLRESSPEQSDDVLAAEEVRPLLERAAAVLEKLGDFWSTRKNISQLG